MTATFRVNGVEVVDTFAEAFPMACCRVIVTAASERWVRAAAEAATGYAASVIGCDAEAGVEEYLSAGQVPDGTPVGVSLLFFAFSRAALEKAVVNRIGQCILTCPTTSCFNGLIGDDGKWFKVGDSLRYFGDGWQISKVITHLGWRLWRIPTMDGEFVCEDAFGTTKGVAGGNFIVAGDTAANTLAAMEAAVDAVCGVRNVIAPFPGGVVRSGSKVGSKYAKLKASTNEAYCPTLRGVVASELPPEANCAYEIVIDGVTLDAVRAAMRAGIDAATKCPGVVRVTAGNYGGKLGPHHIRLRELFP